ncbi:MAG: tRNA lysidine(34) synthetase TilS [Bacilli bacterium]|nr:tRNA lysidine(34) synthetase TilS [Bacilli bacterium]
MDNIKELLQSLNIDGKVIVACSGGPDSMFLLHVLKEYGLDVVCAHVNHNLREESKEEYEYVERYCNDNSIIFEGTELHDLPSVNTELVAREKRYEFFKTLIDKYNAKYLFTAHHGDDLIETVLLRIVRGSTLNGYAGFNIITEKKGYKIVRPLVYMTKANIIKQLDILGIKYYMDATNLDDIHLRNRYRKYVLPILKEEDKNVHLKFLKYHKVAQSYFDYINEKVYEIIEDIVTDNTLDIDKFNKIDEFLKDKVLEEVIRPYYPDDLYLINDNHINELLKMIESDKPNVELILPNMRVVKEYNKLIFNVEKNKVINYKEELQDCVETPCGIIKLIDEDKKDKSNYIIRLNSKDIKLPLYVRNRRDGDKIHVKNMDGTKKINDIFIDNKVPKDLRDVYPIIVDSDDKIIFIPGIKKSNLDIPIDKEYDIIIKYILEE